MKKIAVFGSSKCLPGDSEYIFAYNLGKRLGECGFSVSTGGYQGTMEAVSKGASEHPVEVVGYTVPNLFLGRDGGNKFITKEVTTETLAERIGGLISDSETIVALPGSIGTFTEILVIWNQEFVKECNEMNVSQRIYLYKPFWEPIMKSMPEDLSLPLDLLLYFNNIEDLIQQLEG